MEVSERAAQIWSILALAARNRQVLSYDMVSKAIGVPRAGLGRLLEPVQSYCLINELPPLTVLVVKESSGIPGEGFIAAKDIPEAQASVFAYDWLKHKAPSPEVLQKAVLERPSNGVGPEE